MFGIKIGNEWLDLKPKVKLRIRLESTLFQTTYENPAYSFPFTLPDSDKNRRLTNFASDVQVKGDNNTGINCRLICGSIDWNALLFVIRTQFNNTIQIVLKIVSNNTGKKTLPELNLGGKRNLSDGNNSLPETPDITNNYIRSKDRDYYFGIYYNSTTVLTLDQGVINDIDSSGNYDVVAAALGIAETSRYTPMPYLNYVLKVIANDFGVQTNGSWFSDSELDSLVIFNNRTIERSFVAPPTIPSGTFWKDLDLKNHVPIITVDDFFANLKNVFCLLIENFNGKLTIATFKDILNDLIINDWTFKSERIYERERNKLGGFALNIEYDEADLLYKKLIKTLPKLKYKGALAMPPVTGEGGDWYYDTFYKYYRIYNAGSFGEFYSFGYEGVVSGNEEVTFQTKFNCPVFRPQNQPPLLGYRVPWVEMDSEGSYGEFFQPDIKEYGPKLIFARGWYDNQFLGAPASTIRVPIISGESKDQFGTVWGNYSLRYIEDDGLHNTFWKKFLDMYLENDISFFSLHMTDSDLAKWTFSEWIRIGGQVFLPKAVDIELSELGVETCICEAIRKHE